MKESIYEEYQNWVNIGMILCNELGDEGLQLFDEFSQKSNKYDKNEVIKKFNSFKKQNEGLTYATLKKFAMEDTSDDTKYNFNKGISTGELSDYFKNNIDNYIFCNDKLYYFNVYWREDDKKMSNLNNFIDKTFYKMILKQFHIYENNTRDTEDKTEWFKKIQAMRKEIEKLKSFKPREPIISDILCKITNNDIKFNENSNLFAFNNKIYDI